MFGRLTKLFNRRQRQPLQNQALNLPKDDNASVVGMNDFTVEPNNLARNLSNMQELPATTPHSSLVSTLEATQQRRLGEIMRHSQLVRPAGSVPVLHSSSKTSEYKNEPPTGTICYRLNNQRGLRFQTWDEYNNCRRGGLELLNNNGIFEVRLEDVAVTAPHQIEALIKRMEHCLAIEQPIAPPPQARTTGATPMPSSASPEKLTRPQIRRAALQIIEQTRPAFAVRDPLDPSVSTWVRLGFIPSGNPNNSSELTRTCKDKGVVVQLISDFPNYNMVAPTVDEKKQSVYRTLKEHMALQVATQLGMAPVTTYIFQANVVPQEVGDSYPRPPGPVPPLLLCYRCRQAIPEAPGMTRRPHLSLNLEQLGYILGCKHLTLNGQPSLIAVHITPDGKEYLINPFGDEDPEPGQMREQAPARLGKLNNERWIQAIESALEKAHASTLAFAQRHLPELEVDPDLRDRKALTDGFVQELNSYFVDCSARLLKLTK